MIPGVDITSLTSWMCKKAGGDKLMYSLAIASPHVLYAIIWIFPSFWSRVFGRWSVDVFAACAALGKALQFVCAALWVSSTRDQGVCIDFNNVALVQWVAFLVVFAYGQSLNYGIYHAIGKVGVYYGFKLGHDVPWHTGFPFDSMSHPQYVGSALTIWAFVILLFDQAGMGVYELALFWTGLYVSTGMIESVM